MLESCAGQGCLHERHAVRRFAVAAARTTAHGSDCLELPVRCTRDFGVAARFVDRPVEQIREFVERYVASVDQIPEHIAKPEPKEPLVTELALALSMDDGVMQEFADALDRVPD